MPRNQKIMTGFFFNFLDKSEHQIKIKFSQHGVTLVSQRKKELIQQTRTN
jgi:hypothetical protein